MSGLPIRRLLPVSEPGVLPALDGAGQDQVSGVRPSPAGDGLATDQATATWYAVSGPNGDLTWRVDSPAEAIGAKVVKVLNDDAGFKSLFFPNLDGQFPWVLDVEFTDGTADRISSEDHWKQVTRSKAGLLRRDAVYLEHEGEAAVFTRPLAWSAAHMIELRNQGVRVTAEVDDNYLADKRLNVFMEKMGWGANDRDNHARSISSGDGLIVSTEYLRDAYWRGLAAEFGKKNVPEIFVCRNHIDEKLIPEPSPPRGDGRLRIGYMGSDSHIWDVDLVFDALLEAYHAGHEIVFVGIHPKLLNPKFSRTKKPWHLLEYTHIPWRNEGFRGTALPLDIGLAPLRVDEHTLCKSDIKIMEYALSGAASIAQNCLVYNRTFVHGETALFASGSADYTAQLRRLIADDELRRRLVANTNQYIQEERLLSKNADEWKQAVLG